MRCWEHDKVFRLATRFFRGTRTLAVDAPGVCGKVGLLPFSPGFLGSIASLQFICLFLVASQLEHGGGGVHGQFNVKNGELCALCFLLRFFHGRDEVRHASCIFVEEEHVPVQCYDVEGVETCRVFLQVFKDEVMHKDLVEECGAILEFVDVHLLHRSAD
jgi:hypothetical protein